VKTFDVGEHLDQTSRVQAVTDLYGPTNLAFYGTSQPGDLLSAFIGGPIQDNPAKVQAANPITYASAGDAPIAIFHGDSDPLVPQRHSEALLKALEEAKVPASLKIVPGGGHGFQGQDLQDVAMQVLAFFDKHLKK
jgi:dipeptidyl aminopeptidase/acylaminoacyl peptidase